MSLLTQAAALSDVTEQEIIVGNIQRYSGTQARVQLNEGTVEEYQEIFANQGWVFPPVKITQYGALLLLTDGFHRIEAFRRCTDDPNMVVPALVRPGTKRDAILAAVGANADHGLRRTNADKHNAVAMLLHDDEWCQWSDRMIAEKAHVTHPFVAKIRAELAAAGTVYPLPSPDATDDTGGGLTGNGYQSAAPRKGKDGRTIDTRNIGSSPSTPVPPLSVDEAIQVIYDVVTTVAGRGGVLANALDRLERTPWDRYKYAAARPLDDATIKAALGWVRRKIEKKIQPPETGPTSQDGNTRSDSSQDGNPGQSRQNWGILATDWLTAYQGKNGETWLGLTENQIYHANSPCFQRFTQQHPECPDPKMALRQALVVLRNQVEINGQSDETPAPPTKVDPRPRFANTLTVVAGMFTATDEDLWADDQGNTYLSDLRFLVARMIRELDE